MQPGPTWTPNHAHLIGFDSDGCVFDVMTSKHRSCFGPAFIEIFGLQPVAEAAQTCWDFVNLFSTSRGCNRFDALRRCAAILPSHPGCAGAALPKLDRLASWLDNHSEWSVGALQADAADDDQLQAAIAWSNLVNDKVRAMSEETALFDGAAALIARAAQQADVMVVSQAAGATVVGEWEHAGLTPHLRALASQEDGTKTAQLQVGLANGYEPAQVLMVGDAPGDRDAARAVGACFYPIIPGQEAASWRRLASEALDRFLADNYQGAYQAELDAAFDGALPDQPSWA